MAAYRRRELRRALAAAPAPRGFFCPSQHPPTPKARRIEWPCLHHPYSYIDPQKRLQAIRPEHYPLDYRKILQSHPGQIRQLSWNSFGTIPLYQAQTDYGSKTWDARHSGSLQTLNLTADDIRPILETVHGPNSIYDIQWMTRQDIYYISNKKTLTLPVWKVQIKNADASCYYIDPFSGSYRYVDRPARWQHWMYPALHSLQLPGLVSHPWLWHALMWFLMLGGTFVSVSGVWLTIKYLLRKIRNWIER